MTRTENAMLTHRVISILMPKSVGVQALAVLQPPKKPPKGRAFTFVIL